MQIESTRPAHRRLVGHGVRIAIAALAAVSAAADAKWPISEEIRVTNRLEHSYLPGQVKDMIGGASAKIRRSPAPGAAPEYGADFVSTQEGNGFYFLHNLYCVSLCSSKVTTTVTIRVTNNGNEAAPYRIDSQITPGHLVREGSNSTAQASFDFTVTVFAPGADGYVAKKAYSAVGALNSHTNDIKTGNGLPFNGMKHVQNGAAGDARDWSATNISIPLGIIAPGATVTVVYDAVTQATTTDSSCGNQLQNCPGIQIAFGDPREPGGTPPNNSSIALPMLVDFKAPTDDKAQYGRSGMTPFLGRTFWPYWVKVDVVPEGAPLPRTPDAMPDVQYGAPFKSQTVPQSSSQVAAPANGGRVAGR